MYELYSVCGCLCMRVFCFVGGCMFCTALPSWAFTLIFTVVILIGWSDVYKQKTNFKCQWTGHLLLSLTRTTNKFVDRCDFYWVHRLNVCMQYLTLSPLIKLSSTNFSSTSVCKVLLSHSKLVKNVVWVSNSLDLGETPSYSGVWPWTRISSLVQISILSAFSGSSKLVYTA